VRERLISTAQCEDSIERMRQEGTRQGEVLVSMGAMTHKNLKFALELQLEAKLFDAFRWQEGEYRFNEALALPKAGSRLEWQDGALVVEGIRQTFDEARVRSIMLPSYELSLNWTGKPPSMLSLGLTAREAISIDRLQLPQTTEMILNTTPLAPADSLRVIYSLVALQLLAPV